MKYEQLTAAGKDGQIIFGGIKSEDNENQNKKFVRA
jgi:hypothetical protein